MKRIPPIFFPLFFIITIAIIIRIFYSLYNPQIPLRPDSFGYYELSEQLFSPDFTTYIVNERRGSIYPLFLQTIMIISGHSHAPLLSPSFYEGINLIIMTQTAVGILSIIILFQLLRLIKIKLLYTYLFCFFMAVNPLLFQWERELLTESLGIFLLFSTIYLYIKTLKTPSRKLFFLLFVSLTLSFLNRPIFIALPFILFPLLFLYSHDKTTKIKSLFFLSVHIIFIFFIIHHNTVNFGYKGITRQLDLALLGKILHYNIPVDKSTTSDFFRDNILTYRKINGDPNPFRFVEYFDPDIYAKNYRFNEMKTFNLEVISQNLPEFIYKSTLEVPTAMLQTADIKPLNPNRHDILGFFFELLYSLFKNLQFLSFIILPGVLLTLFHFIKSRTLNNTIWLSLGFLSLYQVLVSVYLDYEDFGRLIGIAQPIIYLFALFTLGKVIKIISKNISLRI